MNFDIPTLRCDVLVIIASKNLFKRKKKKKKTRDFSRDMPHCYFLLMVIVIAIRLIYKHCMKSVHIWSFSGQHFPACVPE